MNEYEQQANDFLKSVNASIKIEWIDNDLYHSDDTRTRDIYKVRIRRKGKQFTFTFGTNLLGDKPTAYAILACLTKYEPGHLDEFCREFGYDEDSKNAERVWKSVLKEWRNVERVFGDCLDELREIQ